MSGGHSSSGRLLGHRGADVALGMCIGAAAACAVLPAMTRRRPGLASEPPEPEPEDAAGATLQLVILLHRHGARFPNKSLPCDLSWPLDAGFWGRSAAEQSPEGTLQMYELGQKLRGRYGARLFRGMAPTEIGRAIRVLSTDTQRTVNSAWSLLLGWLPAVPRHITYRDERRVVTNLGPTELPSARAAATAARICTLGTAIEVVPDGPLFQQLKTCPVNGYQRDENGWESEAMQQMVMDQRVLGAADEL
jgi:hypothetical protein